MNELKKYVKERDEAFTDFVMNDNWDACLKYLKKWYGSVPTNIREDVMKAGIYKAVQECTNIPVEVKAEAAKKCVLLGFKPTMQRYEEEKENEEKETERDEQKENDPDSEQEN